MIRFSTVVVAGMVILASAGRPTRRTGPGGTCRIRRGGFPEAEGRRDGPFRYRSGRLVHRHRSHRRGADAFSPGFCGGWP